ncbi:MAG: ROK family protein [Patescibacteria group bacterium]
MLKDKNYVLTIDIGGSKTEICYFNKSLSCLASKILPTSAIKRQGYLNLRLLADVLQPHLKYQKIGLAIKGIVFNGNLLSSSLLGNANRKDILLGIKKLFGSGVTLINDVEAMAMAEKKFGIGKNESDFVLLNLGTGVRIICVYDGKYQIGAHGVAGEISHLPMIEYNAQAPIESFINQIAYLLLNISAFYDPIVIVLNGGVIQNKKLLLPKIIAKYKSILPPQTKPAKVVISGLKHAACLGAALATRRSN